MTTNKFRMLVGALLVGWGAGSHAADLPISVAEASGTPGGQVVLEVQVDFGSSFEMMTQNLKFQYDPDVLAFAADRSSVVAGAVTTSWSDYFDQLVAISNPQFTTQNFDPPVVVPGRKGYSLDFLGLSDTLALSGIVRYNLAFDIDAGAQPGTTTQVTFDGSALSDGINEETIFPASLNSPGVTVSVVAIPEPSQVLLFLAGLGLFALRRMRAAA